MAGAATLVQLRRYYLFLLYHHIRCQLALTVPEGSYGDGEQQEETNVQAAVRVGHVLALCSAITVSLGRYGSNVPIWDYDIRSCEIIKYKNYHNISLDHSENFPKFFRKWPIFPAITFRSMMCCR